MGEIAYPKERTFFKTNNGGGFTDADQVTSSGDPNFQKNTDATTLYPALPNLGALKQGEIYSYNGGMVIVEQDHNRTIYPPEDTPALFSVYRKNSEGMEWVANEQVIAGDKRTYGGKTYQCIQSHQSQESWNPELTVGTLWQVVPATAEWTIGVAYKVNDIVTYQGNTYRCLQGHTSQAGWFPSAVPALWQLQ